MNPPLPTLDDTRSGVGCAGLPLAVESGTHLPTLDLDIGIDTRRVDAPEFAASRGSYQA